MINENSLAIVIPYYKSVFFEETLISLANQTYNRFTLYIGNDASPNDPRPLIQKYFPEGGYHYFDYRENLGGKNLTMQWERILENVTEEWFQILGDDDTISENFVEEFYKNLKIIEKYECNVVKFSQCWIDENGNTIRKCTKYKQILTPSENWGKKYVFGDQSSLSEHIFLTSTYNKIGFRDFPLAWGTDDIAVLELSQDKNIFFINDAKVFVRISSENISGKESYKQQKEYANHLVTEYLINNHRDILPKNYLAAKIREQIHYAFKNNPSDLRISPVKLYWSLKDYRSLLALPKIYYYLYKNKWHRKFQ